MGDFSREDTWLPILRAQEERLRFDRFGAEEALAVGLNIVRLAKEQNRGSVAICIVQDDAVLFSYKMPGTTVENDWWMFRKINASKATGVSSLRAYLEIEAGLRTPTWAGREGSFVACGGCMPVFLRAGESGAYIAVSGLAHNVDHQLIADAVAATLGASIESVAP